MDGKKVIIFIVSLCIILTLLTWFFGQKFIKDQNLDEALIEIVD